jgi:hypothetical protein
VVFAAGSFVARLGEDASGEAELGAIEAVEAAAEGLDLRKPADLRVLSRSAKETVVSRGGISERPFRRASAGSRRTTDGASPGS